MVQFLVKMKICSVSGYEKVLIKSSDFNVEVNPVARQNQIVARIYILSGAKQCTSLIDISETNTKLNQEICDALLGLHAFTCCDSVSAFLGKSKKVPTSTSSNAKFRNVY